MFGKRILTVAFLVLTATATARGSSNLIKVTNTGPVNWTLSDLIVFDAIGTKHVIKAPGNAADDQEIGPGESPIFTAPFDVAKYIVSTQIGPNEYESSVLQVTKVAPRKLVFAERQGGGAPIYLSFDETAGNYDDPDLSESAVISITAGASALVPGMFVGTSINLDTGVVSGAYTGNMVVLDAETYLDLPTAIPTVSQWGLIIMTLLLLTAATIIFARARRHEPASA